MKSFHYEFLEGLLLFSPSLCIANLSLSLGKSDERFSFPCVETESVGLIGGEPSLRARSSILANSSQIVLQPTADSFLLQEGTSFGIPLQRVSIEVLVFHGRHDLLGVMS